MGRLSLFSLLSMMLISSTLCLAEPRLLSDQELGGIVGQNGLLLSILRNQIIFGQTNSNNEQLEQLREHEQRFIELELNFTQGAHVPAQFASDLRESLQSTNAIGAVALATDTAISIPFSGQIHIPFMSGGFFGLGGGLGGGFGINPDLSVTLQIPEQDEDQDESNEAQN